MADLLAQALVSGLLAGGVYALLALGLALSFGTMGIVNLAHGELVLLAAYAAYLTEARGGLPPYLALPLALVAVAVCSGLLFLLIDRIRAHRALNALLLSYGAGIVLTNGLLLAFGGDPRTAAAPALQAALTLGSVYATVGEVVACGLGLALTAGLWWWLRGSWYGRAVRAVAANRAAATLMGIDPWRIEFLAFLVAGALASCAGVALYTMSVVQPALGHALTVKAFIVTVLAGIGSLPGLVLAALLLGVTEALTVTLASSALQELAGMALFLLVLFLLPSGLLGARARRG